MEFYGEALERVCLDLRMSIKNYTHDVKIKVHNTQCSLDVAAFHDEVGKKHSHLNDLTVSEYFAQHVISNVVEMLLNEHLRYLANEGKNLFVLRTLKSIALLAIKMQKHLRVSHVTYVRIFIT